MNGNQCLGITEDNKLLFILDQSLLITVFSIVVLLNISNATMTIKCPRVGDIMNNDTLRFP